MRVPVDGIRVTPFSRPVSRASNARAEWSARDGAIITLTSGGLEGRGELSPLPGYSPDSLDAGLRELEAVDPSQLTAHSDGLSSFGLPTLHSPALRFALETALLDLGARYVDAPAWALLGTEAESVPVAALLPSIESAEAEAEALLQAGFRCMKLKVGRPDRFSAELATVRAIRRLGTHFELRVDANQAFGAELGDRLRALNDAGVDLVEEPSGDLAAWPSSRTPPLALDESLQNRRPGELPSELGAIRALVLKPAVLGGLERSLRWALEARGRGLEAIVSHLFDGPVAAGAYRALAVVLGGKTAHGLGANLGGGPRLQPASEVGLDVWREEVLR